MRVSLILLASLLVIALVEASPSPMGENSLINGVDEGKENELNSAMNGPPETPETPGKGKGKSKRNAGEEAKGKGKPEGKGKSKRNAGEEAKGKGKPEGKGKAKRNADDKEKDKKEKKPKE